MLKLKKNLFFEFLRPPFYRLEIFQDASSPETSQFVFIVMV